MKLNRRGFIVGTSLTGTILFLWILGSIQVYNEQIAKARDAQRITNVSNLNSTIWQYSIANLDLKNYENKEEFIEDLKMYSPRISEIIERKENCINSKCGFVYIMNANEGTNNGENIANKNYEISTAFESRDNIYPKGARAKIDGGNDENRFEVGSKLELNTSYPINGKLASGALVIK